MGNTETVMESSYRSKGTMEENTADVSFKNEMD